MSIIGSDEFEPTQCDRAGSHLEWKLMGEYAADEVSHITYERDHREPL